MESLDRRLTDAIEATKHVATFDDAVKLREHIKKMAHELATSVYPPTVKRELTRLRNMAVAKANLALQRAETARNVKETSSQTQRVQDEVHEHRRREAAAPSHEQVHWDRGISPER
jgi:hypothetical protein